MTEPILYWWRTGSAGPLGVWLLLAGVVWLGGWLLATHAFRLEGAVRLLLGFGLGLGIYLWTANLLAHLLPPAAAFSSAALAPGLLGLAFVRGGARPILDIRDLRAWPVLLVGVIFGWVFLRVSQGVAIFDDYVHLPLISTMAAGNIPPRYFVNAEVNFAYHYGFQLFGASLMRLGGLTPWGAFDLSKAILWGYAVLLAFTLGQQLTRSRWGGVTIAGLVLFAGGTRYLLLLMPAGFLQAADPLIAFQGAEVSLGAPFSESLLQTWPLDGGPPYSFLFAYLSGIGRPLVMAHAGLNILNAVLLLLFWTVAPHANRPGSALILAILLALWGLTWETTYVLILAGVLLAAGYRLWRDRALPAGAFRLALTAALLSLPIVLVQGGLLTEIARQMLFGASAAGPGAASSAQAAGFSLRWPPAIVSAHLGPLPLTSPRALALALFELGPVILFTPWITSWSWRRFRQDEWMPGALILSAWVGFAIPLLLRYQSDTDISRISEHAMLVWVILLGAMLWDRAARWAPAVQYTAGFGLGLMAFGGAVLFGSALTAGPHPILSYKFDPLDARISQAVWDQLPAGSEVFDAQGWRATALTGRLTRAVSGDLSFANPDNPQWEALREAPAPAAFLDAGYAFVYVDEKWWREIGETGRGALSDPCVAVMAAFEDPVEGLFRQLLDLQGCR